MVRTRRQYEKAGDGEISPVVASSDPDRIMYHREQETQEVDDAASIRNRAAARAAQDAQEPSAGSSAGNSRARAARKKGIAKKTATKASGRKKSAAKGTGKKSGRKGKAKATAVAGEDAEQPSSEAAATAAEAAEDQNADAGIEAQAAANATAETVKPAAQPDLGTVATTSEPAELRDVNMEGEAAVDSPALADNHQLHGPEEHNTADQPASTRDQSPAPETTPASSAQPTGNIPAAIDTGLAEAGGSAPVSGVLFVTPISPEVPEVSPTMAQKEAPLEAPAPEVGQSDVGISAFQERYAREQGLAVGTNATVSDEGATVNLGDHESGAEDPVTEDTKKQTLDDAHDTTTSSPGQVENENVALPTSVNERHAEELSTSLAAPASAGEGHADEPGTSPGATDIPQETAPTTPDNAQRVVRPEGEGVNSMLDAQRDIADFVDRHRHILDRSPETVSSQAQTRQSEGSLHLPDSSADSVPPPDNDHVAGPPPRWNTELASTIDNQLAGHHMAFAQAQQKDEAAAARRAAADRPVIPRPPSESPPPQQVADDAGVAQVSSTPPTLIDVISGQRILTPTPGSRSPTPVDVGTTVLESTERPDPLDQEEQQSGAYDRNPLTNSTEIPEDDRLGSDDDLFGEDGEDEDEYEPSVPPTPVGLALPPLNQVTSVPGLRPAGSGLALPPIQQASAPSLAGAVHPREDEADDEEEEAVKPPPSKRPRWQEEARRQIEEEKQKEKDDDDDKDHGDGGALAALLRSQGYAVEEEDEEGRDPYADY